MVHKLTNFDPPNVNCSCGEVFFTANELFTHIVVTRIVDNEDCEFSPGWIPPEWEAMVNAGD